MSPFVNIVSDCLTPRCVCRCVGVRVVRGVGVHGAREPRVPPPHLPGGAAAHPGVQGRGPAGTKGTPLPPPPWK